MNKKFTVVISNPTEPIGLGSRAFGGVVCAAYDVDLGETKTTSNTAEVDPLQGAVDWLITAHSRLTVAYVQRTFIIGYNRAQRLYETALAKHGEAK